MSDLDPNGVSAVTTPVPRRRVIATAAGLGVAVLLASGCRDAQGAPTGGGVALAPPGGRLFIATGNTTGVYYQLGWGYADLISKHLPAWHATAEPTGASVENIQRVGRGDAHIGFTLADAAADAALGRRPFTSPQPIRALARIYSNYTHVIARTGTGISDLATMKGMRVSTGSPNSGTENIAFRLLAAAGLDPARDVVRRSLSLPETVAGIKDATIDALFWSGGLPTTGITDLVNSLPGGLIFLPLDGLFSRAQQAYGQAYQPAILPGKTYKIARDVPTIAVPNLLIVNETMQENLAHDLTELLFDYRTQLGDVHPEATNIVRENGPRTAPVPLHPGAARYFGEA